MYGQQTIGWKLFSTGNIYTDNGAPGAYVKYKFQGSYVSLSAERSRTCGIAAISILDENDAIVVAESEVDLYANQNSAFQKVYEKTLPSEKVYSILIKITNKFNPNNSPQNLVGGIYVPQCWTINIAGISILTTAATPTPCSVPSFTDIDGHWGSSYINALAAKGIISGYQISPGMFEFKPDNLMQRQEFAKIITVAYDVYDSAVTSPARKFQRFSTSQLKNNKYIYQFV